MKKIIFAILTLLTTTSTMADNNQNDIDGSSCEHNNSNLPGITGLNAIENMDKAQFKGRKTRILNELTEQNICVSMAEEEGELKGCFSTDPEVYPEAYRTIPTHSCHHLK